MDMTLSNLMVRLQEGKRFKECGVHSSSPMFQGPLYPGVVAPERVLSMVKSYLPTPPHGQDMTQGQFLNGV